MMPLEGVITGTVGCMMTFSDLQAPSALAILYHACALAPECHSHRLGIIAPPLGPRLHHGSM